MKRTVVIGDVHGCADELSLLLEATGATAADRILQVGDLVAKGPDSAGVLKLCRERGIQAVLGNHDGHALKRRKQGQGGKGEPLSQLTEEDWAYLDALPLFLRVPEHNLLVVHAGLVPGVPVEKQDREHLLTMRSIDADGVVSKKAEPGAPWASLWRGPELVVFGHDAKRGLQSYPLAVGLDTGCVYGKELTALVLPERRLVSVKARRVYSAPVVRD